MDTFRINKVTSAYFLYSDRTLYQRNMTSQDKKDKDSSRSTPKRGHTIPPGKGKPKGKNSSKGGTDDGNDATSTTLSHQDEQCTTLLARLRQQATSQAHSRKQATSRTRSRKPAENQARSRDLLPSQLLLIRIRVLLRAPAREDLKLSVQNHPRNHRMSTR
jgi:hypothetical protein